ncbi:MAG TPA: NADH-quinone oxidoreductase subunit L [Croceibacterium sp.]|nr:NADH-quinone oxidoreductase subunit L [Croceibacterium sp.]
MTLETLLVIAVFAPLLGAIVAGLFGKRIGNVPSMAVTTGLLFLSCAIAWYAFYLHTWGGQGRVLVELLRFIDIGDFRSTWSIRFDALSAVMLVVVTTVSALVHLYSWGYMAEDPGKPRFFAYLSLFTFAMLALVTANDFMQLFFGWEGVGLASYLLIGFWFHKATANAASIKAFVVNRVGDFGFALGIMTVFWMFNTIQFAELFPLLAAKASTSWWFAGSYWRAVDLACALLFVGAMGKSAQFFLHTWLPDAMEGPTPVSALIHAATMVTAGVYMVCLLSPIYEYAPYASQIIALTGAVTALFAATVGLAQNDIKRVIAYSTCSQLGYMFFAAGVGAYGAAMFHLFTHAFFKALLFLGAGSVIHAMHHEQDMRYYGDLRRHIPLTFWAMLAGTLAITGVGLVGVFGFAGFYSKDAILEAAFASGSEMGRAAFWLGAFAALLTSFYSWRLMFLTFWGHPRWADSEHIQHAVHGHHESPDEEHGDSTHAEIHPHEGTAGYHPHESPWSMLVPLILLSVGAVFAGFVFHAPFLEEAAFWGGSIAWDEHLMHAMHEVPTWVKLTATVVMLIGLLVAWTAYIRDTSIPHRAAEQLGPVYRFLYNKWYFDELYHWLFVRPAFWLGRLFWKRGDEGLIDRFGPDGAAWAVDKGALVARRVQSGYLTSYALIMLLGLVGAISWVLV